MKAVVGVIGAVLGFCLIAVLGLALSGLLIMLIMGGLHAYVHEGIPAVGFVGSVLIALALSVVSAPFRK